jgi:raffinose/stachyose/melibiose transport system permease protein
MRSPAVIAARRATLYGGLTAGALLWLFPLGIVLTTAVRVHDPGRFGLVPQSFTFHNIVSVLNQTNLWRLFVNSTIVTVASTLAVLLLSSLAAYGFTQHRFRGTNVLLFTLLSGLMIAPAALIVPLYVEINDFGLLNNYMGLIGPYSAFGLAIGVLLFRNSFLAVPRELSDAARVDGSSPLRTYWKVFLPLSRPVIATVAILQFLGSWNDYILALLIMTKANMGTVQLAYIAYYNQYLSAEEKEFALLTLVMLPVLVIFVALQREFIRGLTGGAVNK